MTEIFQRDKVVRAILGKQKWTGEGNFLWSVFVFPFRQEGAWYLYHYLTKQCLAVEEALYRSAVSREKLDGASVRGDGALSALADGFFLVPEGLDETRTYEGLMRLLRLRSAKKRIRLYTILPTTACNARCFYCFEENAVPLTMSEETVEQTIRYILNTRDPDTRIQLRWFGGEPLVASRVIYRISEALNREGVAFSASMVSNARLLSDEIARKMAGPWHIRRIQISLDGAEEEYNRRKNYPRNGASAYREVLENIRRLSDLPIQVVLRCNVDEDNIDGVGQMIDDLAACLPRRDHFYFYFAPLFAQRAGAGHEALVRKGLEAKRYAKSLGFPYVPQSPLHRTRHTPCCAEDPFGSTIIDPKGKLYNCDYCLPEMCTGDIWQGVSRPDYLRTFVLPEPVPDKCRGCCFLPACTSFSRCPVKKADCKQVQAVQLLYDLRNELEERTAVTLDPPFGEEPEPLC